MPYSAGIDTAGKSSGPTVSNWKLPQAIGLSLIRNSRRNLLGVDGDANVKIETGSNSNMAAVCFQKPEVIISQPWIEIPRRNLVYDLHNWAKLQKKTKPEVALRFRGRHLRKWIWRHNSVTDGPIWTKFGRQMQNDMPMLTQTWKLKPDVEFQHGRDLILETRGSNISAVDWDISPKFGLHVDFDFPK